MAWKVEFADSAAKALGKLGLDSSRRVIEFLRNRVAGSSNPRFQGKPLKGPLGEFWRYRVGTIRVICDIQDDCLRILVVKVGDRKDVYRRR